MRCSIVFRQAANPEEAAITDEYPRAGTESYISVSVPYGGLDRFMTELTEYMKLFCPDFYLGQELKIFHPALPEEEVVEAKRKIQHFADRWADSTEEKVTTF